MIDIFREVWKTGKPNHFPSKQYVDENHVFRLSSGEIVVIYNDVTECEMENEELKKTSNLLSAMIDSAHLQHLPVILPKSKSLQKKKRTMPESTGHGLTMLHWE